MAVVVMAEVLLVLSKEGHEFTYLRVKCTPKANLENLKTRDRRFRHPSDLERALIAAGVRGHEARAPFQVFETGLSTFIPASLDVARRLDLCD